MSDNGDDGREGGAENGMTEDTVVEILGFDEESEAEIPATPAPGANERRLESELAVERERYLRLRADFDNFRKRAERERGEIERYALAEPARELLPVVDNLERALAAQGSSEDLRRGVEMILRQLEELLRRFGLTPVAALGERFDPSVHEAVMREESGEVSLPTVVAELQRGYRLNDRLLRPAMVKVVLPIEPQDSGDGSPDAGE
jgi:molecular chaperone GrpE